MLYYFSAYCYFSVHFMQQYVEGFMKILLNILLSFWFLFLLLHYLQVYPVNSNISKRTTLFAKLVSVS